MGLPRATAATEPGHSTPVRLTHVLDQRRPDRHLQRDTRIPKRREHLTRDPLNVQWNQRRRNHRAAASRDAFAHTSRWIPNPTYPPPQPQPLPAANGIRSTAPAKPDTKPANHTHSDQPTDQAQAPDNTANTNQTSDPPPHPRTPAPPTATHPTPTAPTPPTKSTRHRTTNHQPQPRTPARARQSTALDPSTPPNPPRHQESRIAPLTAHPPPMTQRTPLPQLKNLRGLQLRHSLKQTPYRLVR